MKKGDVGEREYIAGEREGREGEGGGEGRERERLILKVPLYMQKDWQN